MERTLIPAFALVLGQFAYGQAGVLDATFDPGTGADDQVQAISVQPDGQILVGGRFSTFNGILRHGIVRLNQDGSLDTTFDPGEGTNFGNVSGLTLQPDGRVIIAGTFHSYDGIPRHCLARLESDGSLDATFDPDGGIEDESSSAQVVVVLADDKLLVGGHFSEYDSIPRTGIIRLNSDASMDTTFNPGSGLGSFGTVHDIVVQPDGKIIIGGTFYSYDGIPRMNIARLNADGSLDSGFDPGDGTDASVFAVSLQPDGKVLIGGYFEVCDGIARQHIARLNADGSLDMGYEPGSGANNAVLDIDLLPDGTSIAVGAFYSFNGLNRRGIVHLTANGSVEADLDPGAGASNIHCVARQSDDRMLIGGYFDDYDGTARNNIARVGGIPLHTQQIPSGSVISAKYDPLSQQVYVTLDRGSAQTVTLVDMTGRSIAQRTGTVVSFDVQNCARGTYVVHSAGDNCHLVVY